MAIKKTIIPGPWWQAGLRFSCVQCGSCCTGAPGIVSLSKSELGPLAKAMKVTKEEFLQLFANIENNEIQLREKRNFDCIFWDKRKGCLVYQVRPLQCKTWPFWKRLLETKKTWNDEAANCPGMNSGRCYDANQILKLSQGLLSAEDVFG